MSEGSLKATLLAGLWPLGFGVGGAVGMGIGVAIKVLEYNGWSALTRIQLSPWGFPELPSWFGEEQRSSTNLVGGVLALVCAALGIVLMVRVWHYLVVKRFGWLTRDQAEDFMRRSEDP